MSLSRLSGDAVECGHGRTGWSGREGIPGARDARRLSDERADDFLRASIDWTWETDRELCFVFIAPAVARRLGRPPEALLGRSLTTVGRFASSASGSELGSGSAVAAHRPFREAQYVMEDASGGEVAAWLSGVPYFDEATGRFAGYRGTARWAGVAPGGESEAEAAGRHLVRTLEEVLLQNNDLRWRLSRAGDDPGLSAERLASLLHELRTPLNAVMGYADLLLAQGDDRLDQKQAGYISNIREAGGHLQRLLGDLQAQGRGRHGRAHSPGVESGREPVDIGAVVTEARAMTELEGRRAGLSFDIKLPDGPCRVLGDPGALTQILVNLFNNAIKFTPAGGQIGAEVQRTSEGTVEIVVWDTGPGVPPEDRERVFERRYRLPRDRGGQAPLGEGLGLAIARELAREQGGDLVLTEDGPGARFRLRLQPAAANDVARP